MRQIDKKTLPFLLAAQSVGIVFIGFFLAAYLGGLPSTNVLHSEATFRIPLIILGAVLLVLALSTVIVAALSRKK